MSKYSPKERITGKLVSAQEEFLKKHGILTGDLMDDNLSEEQIAGLDKDLFGLAIVDESEAERTGYSNYSYWGSTVRMFFKNKVAVFNLIVMLALVLFTFIQPHLPNQFDPNLVNYYDSKAVWFQVEDDGGYTVDGMKRTKGDYAVVPAADEILAYIQTPSSWGTPEAFAYNEEGEETHPYLQRRAVFGGSRGPIDLAVGTGGGSRGLAHPRPGPRRRKWNRRRSGPYSVFLLPLL